MLMSGSDVSSNCPCLIFSSSFSCLILKPIEKFQKQYECFNGDFYEQSSDAKDLLQSLAAASTPLMQLGMDNMGQDTNLTTCLTSDHNSLNSPNSPNSHNSHELLPQFEVSVMSNGRYTDYIDGKFLDFCRTVALTPDLNHLTLDHRLSTELASDLDSRYWESKPPEQWTSEDVWHWIFSWAGDRSVDVEEVQPLAYSNMTGHQLCQMSRNDFVNINPKYGGHIFETLAQLSNQFRKFATHQASGIMFPLFDYM